MEYVGLLRFRPQVSVEERDRALLRRAAWQYPEGIRVIAEYWPVSEQVQVVTVFSAESFAPVMQVELEWSDVFDISVFPAVSAEEGLQIGGEVFGRLSRLQGPPPVPGPRAEAAQASPTVQA
jgi:hypothetical protein